MVLLAKSSYTTRVKQGITIDRDLWEKLNTLSEKTMIPKSKLIDKSLILLFEEYEKNKFIEK